jgi:hypothetical protein
MLGGFLHICTGTCTIYCGLWPPDNTSCIFLTWYQSLGLSFFWHAQLVLDHRRSFFPRRRPPRPPAAASGRRLSLAAGELRPSPRPLRPPSVARLVLIPARAPAPRSRLARVGLQAPSSSVSVCRPGRSGLSRPGRSGLSPLRSPRPRLRSARPSEPGRPRPLRSLLASTRSSSKVPADLLLFAPVRRRRPESDALAPI